MYMYITTQTHQLDATKYECIESFVLPIALQLLRGQVIDAVSIPTVCYSVRWKIHRVVHVQQQIDHCTTIEKTFHLPAVDVQMD